MVTVREGFPSFRDHNGNFPRYTCFIKKEEKQLIDIKVETKIENDKFKLHLHEIRMKKRGRIIKNN